MLATGDRNTVKQRIQWGEKESGFTANKNQMYRFRQCLNLGRLQSNTPLYPYLKFAPTLAPAGVSLFKILEVAVLHRKRHIFVGRIHHVDHYTDDRLLPAHRVLSFNHDIAVFEN